MRLWGGQVSLSDKLLNLEGSDKVEDTKSPTPPPSWQPGVVWEGDRGEITTGPLDKAPEDWSDLLRSRGMDPEVYEIVDDTIRWCSYDGWRRDEPGTQAYSVTCYSYKASIRLRRGRPDLEALYKEVRKDRPKKLPTDTGDRTLVIALSDWQVGNGDAGGARSQIEQIAAIPDLASDHVKYLNKRYGGLEHIVIAGLGDLLEGTCGFYPSQPFLTELDRREQTRVVRRGITDVVRALSALAPKLTVTAVGGNHGENREGFKRVTGFGDNDDVAVFEQVAEIFQENPDTYGHISWRLPTDRLAVSVNCAGRIVAFTHGHLPRPKGNAAETMWGWWKDQSHGRFYPGVADADILVTGHYHHLNVKQQQGRTVFVCPSLTKVGDWWGNATGMSTVPGTLSFLVAPDGWHGLEVLR